MRAFVLVSLVGLLSGCGVVAAQLTRDDAAEERVRAHVYNYTRPEAVAEADWSACHARADRATMRKFYGKLAYGGGSQYKEREEDYEQDMRKCLKATGYPIEPAPEVAKPGFTTQ